MKLLSTGRQIAIPIVLTILGKNAPMSLSSEIKESIFSESTIKSGNRIILIALSIDSNDFLFLNK